MSEKRIVGNEVKNRMVFYIVMVLTLVLTLGFSNAVSAKTKVKTLALSLKDNKEKLNQDIKFLHTLLNSIASKLKQSSTNQFVYQSIEERFLYYLKYYC